MGTRWTRSWTGSLLVAGMAGASVVPTFALGVTPGTGAVVVSVIVDGTSSDLAADAVRAVGGVVDAPLDLIGGVAAAVPADAVGDLVSAGFLVVPDQTVSPVDLDVGPQLPGQNNQVEALNPVTSGTEAAAGEGVTIALIDTGVSPHADLAGRVTAGVDLSLDAEDTDSAEGSLHDEYGHGTFIAGLIAGEHTGVAPDAELVSIKVAGKTGDTTLHTLIAAIGWAVANQYDDKRGIDILNLSFGANTGLPAFQDPLAQAVEAAWASGLLVVAAAGNEGAGRVTSPGTSPSALTVGATDHGNTTDIVDDVLAEWSGTAAGPVPKPELVAPGTSVISTLAAGSTIEADHSDSDDSIVPPGYFVGSGTSMSTALATGAAAVVLAHHPDAAPADVKSALVDTARPLSAGNARTIDVHAAATATSQPVPAAPGRSGTTVPAAGPRAADGMTNGWDPTGARWTGARWTGTSWTGARWTGARWTGARWTEEEWADQEWAGARWTGARWTGARWTEEEWAGARWTGARWTGARWTGARWTGTSWTGARWTGTSWTGTSWTMADLEGSEQP